MAENTKIQWAHSTFNCWRGCTKVSAGCANCYAETMSKRNPGTLGVWGPNGTRVVASESMWREPLKWNRLAAEAGERHRVFCASLADVFEDWQGTMVGSQGEKLWMPWSGSSWWKPSETRPCPRSSPLTMQGVRNRLFNLIDQTPNLDWLLLTKRPENIARMMPTLKDGSEVPIGGGLTFIPSVEARRSNLWLGTSVENQQAADERIPHLLKVPAAVRFLSVEPLLGPVDFEDVPVGMFGPLRPESYGPRIDWVIVGGESGPGARPCNVEWIRSIVQQCKSAGVPVFVKQLGANCIEDARPKFAVTRQIPLRDPKGGDITEFPSDLQIREFPR